MTEASWFDLHAEKGPFFKVLETTGRTQVGLMTIAPGEEAGPPEVHEAADQVFHIVAGTAEMKVWEDDEDAAPVRREASAGTVVVVPAGLRHWVKSIGAEPLFFLTVYGPPAY